VLSLRVLQPPADVTARFASQLIAACQDTDYQVKTRCNSIQVESSSLEGNRAVAALLELLDVWRLPDKPRGPPRAVRHVATVAAAAHLELPQHALAAQSLHMRLLSLPILQVRIAAAEQLPVLARVLGPSATVDKLLPELSELLTDDEVQVSILNFGMRSARTLAFVAA
jgi:hypothetical protein